MQLSKRLTYLGNEMLNDDFEEILKAEEFLNEDGEIEECWFCETDDIIEEMNEYCKFENEMKMKLKKMNKDICYHEMLNVWMCDGCGSILCIKKENGNRIWNKNNL